MNPRIIIAALLAAALAVPAAAIAQPGDGHRQDGNAKAHGKVKKSKKAKKVMFVFKGTFTAPGTVQVVSGNSHARKGGFVGESVTFEFADAKIVAADTNGDQAIDLADVKDADVVLVQARVARRTKYAADADAIVARKLVDKTHEPVNDDSSELPDDDSVAS